MSLRPAQRIPEAWARASAFGGVSPTVASYATDRFERYVRVFNPAFERGGQTEARRRTWRSLLDGPDMVSGAGLQWSDLLRRNPEAAALDEPSMGSVELTTPAALAEILRGHTETPGVCFFAWWNGYADVQVPTDAPTVRLPPNRKVFIMEGDVRDGGHLHPRIGIERTPLRRLPADGAWCVGNDIYARSVFIGGTASMIAALAEHPQLESYVVAPEMLAPAEDW